MRRADIIGLALAALYQQKLRTALTTLGVLFGSFVLTFSLSMARGVQETIAREYSRYAGLRNIDVMPNYQPAPPTTTDDQVDVKGNPNPEKRSRLQHEIARREKQQARGDNATKLTPERLEAVRALPHVKEVNPDVDIYGRAMLDRKVEDAYIHSAPSNDEPLKARIVAGSYLRPEDTNTAVVSEYLLYQLGIVDDAAVQAILGRTLRLEFRIGVNKPNVFLMLFNANRAGLGVDEQELLTKVVKNLPSSLDKLNLSPAEQEALRKLLEPPAKASEVEPEVVSKEFAIVGVIRGVGQDEQRPAYFDWWQNNVDVVLPSKAATEWFFEAATNRKNGLQRVMLETDSIESVKETTAAIKTLGLDSRSLVELIEREQFTYLILFGVMTCIAGVAMMVAALGIINTMLMSVLERTREIGVMKAVGARHGHILTIFLVEGALIGIAGGVLGLLVAWIVSLPTDAWMHSLVSERMKIELKGAIYVWPAWLVLGAPLFACLITTLAGYSRLVEPRG